jgi:hypothetical protein
LNFAFNTSFAEATWNQYPIVTAQQSLSTFVLNVDTLNARNANMSVMMYSGMVERFVDRFIRIFVFGVFTNDGDTDLVLGVSQTM